MSPRTAFLGKLIGLYSIAISLSMFSHPQTTVEMMKSIVQNQPLLFIAGLLGMTAGLAIILAHNVWSGGVLPVMVTLFGWAALVKGLLLLILPPETQSRVFFTGLGYQDHPDIYAAILFLLGAYMTFAAFSSTNRHPQSAMSKI